MTPTPAPTPPSPAPTPELKVEAKVEPTVAPVVEPLTAQSITFPEGVTVDEPVRDEFIGILNNVELSPQARAQALVDLQAKVVEQTSEKASQYFTEIRTGWIKQVETELGADLNPSAANIAKLIDAYGGTKEQVAEIRDTFALTGAGDNPAIFRLMNNLAKELVKEGRPLGGQPAGGARTAAEILFPSQAKG